MFYTNFAYIELKRWGDFILNGPFKISLLDNFVHISNRNELQVQIALWFPIEGISFPCSGVMCYEGIGYSVTFSVHDENMRRLEGTEVADALKEKA